MNLKYILSGKKKYNLSNAIGGAFTGFTGLGVALQHTESHRLSPEEIIKLREQAAREQATREKDAQIQYQLEEEQYNTFKRRVSVVQTQSDLIRNMESPIETLFRTTKLDPSISYEQLKLFLIRENIIDKLKEWIGPNMPITSTYMTSAITWFIDKYYKESSVAATPVLTDSLKNEPDVITFKKTYNPPPPPHPHNPPRHPPPLNINHLINDFIKDNYPSETTDSWNLICSHGVQIPNSYVIIPQQFKLQAGCECGHVIGDCQSTELRRLFFNNSKTRIGLFNPTLLYDEYTILPNINIYFNGASKYIYMLTGIIHDDISVDEYGDKMCLSEKRGFEYSACSPSASCVTKSFYMDTGDKFNTELLKKAYIPRLLQCQIPNQVPYPTGNKLTTGQLLWGKMFKLNNILQLLHEHEPATVKRYILFACRNNTDYSCHKEVDEYKRLVPELWDLLRQMKDKLPPMAEGESGTSPLHTVITYLTTILTRLQTGQLISCTITESDIPEYRKYLQKGPRMTLAQNMILAREYEIGSRLITILVCFKHYIENLLKLSSIITPTDPNYIALEVLTTKLSINTIDEPVAMVAPAAPAAPTPIPVPAAPTPIPAPAD